MTSDSASAPAAKEVRLDFGGGMVATGSARCDAADEIAELSLKLRYE